MALKRNIKGEVITPHQVYVTDAQAEASETHKARQLAKRGGVARRRDERAKRTPGQQLARLDALLGRGVGAVRERERLAVQAETEQ